MNCQSCQMPMVMNKPDIEITSDVRPDGTEMFHAHVGGGIHIAVGMKVKDGNASFSLCSNCVKRFMERKAQVDKEAQENK